MPLWILAALSTGCGPSSGGGDAPVPADTQGTSETGAAALLLRGRIGPDTLVLEPVFLLPDSRSGVGEADALHRLVGLDASGAVLFDVGVGTAAVADAQPPEAHFQLVLPTSLEEAARLHRVELRASDGRVARRTASSSPRELREAIAAGDVVATRASDGRVRLTWSASRFPALMVTDPHTGQVLTFARGGAVTLTTERDTLRVTLSDGVQSGSASIGVR